MSFRNIQQVNENAEMVRSSFTFAAVCPLEPPSRTTLEAWLVPLPAPRPLAKAATLEHPPRVLT